MPVAVSQLFFGAEQTPQLTTVPQLFVFVPQTREPQVCAVLSGTQTQAPEPLHEVPAPQVPHDTTLPQLLVLVPHFAVPHVVAVGSSTQTQVFEAEQLFPEGQLPHETSLPQLSLSVPQFFPAHGSPHELHRFVDELHCSFAPQEPHEKLFPHADLEPH